MNFIKITILNIANVIYIINMSVLKRIKDFLVFKNDNKIKANIDVFRRETYSMVSYILDLGFNLNISNRFNSRNIPILIVQLSYPHSGVYFYEIKDDLLQYLFIIDKKYNIYANGIPSSIKIASYSNFDIKDVLISDIDVMPSDFFIEFISFVVYSDGL